jgi:hypothetical protein
MGYQLDGHGSIPGEARDFSLLYNMQTSSGAQPASYPVGNGGSFHGVKLYLHSPIHLHGMVLKWLV